MGQSGAGIVEIVIATLILSIAAIGVGDFFASGRAAFDQEERKRVGTLLAQEALERTVAQAYADIGPWTEFRTIASVDFTITVSTQTNVPEQDIKTIHCDVTWNVNPTDTRTASLETFVYDK